MFATGNINAAARRVPSIWRVLNMTTRHPPLAVGPGIGTNPAARSRRAAI
jgi:hypothetical protein